MEEGKKEKTKVKRRIKRVKIKKKKLIPIIIILLIILIGIGLLLYRVYEKSTIKNIKSKFSENVITIKNTKLYNENQKSIGTITKGYELELESLKNYSLKNTYLKVKNSNYYVHYKDLKKMKPKKREKEDSYYLPLNKIISTKEAIVLYDDNKEIASLKNEIENASVQKEDKDNYYILFLNKTLRLPKTSKIKEKEANIDTEGSAKHVSVIYYNRIKNDCGGDETCLKPISVKAHLNKLKENNYYFITKDDYINYLNEFINLKEKAIFITTGEINEEVNNINNELKANISKIEESDGIKLSITNKTSIPDDPNDNINCYQAKSYTVIDKYLSMAEGQDTPDNGKETSNNQSIAVINYHFFYDDTIPGERDACNESICLEREKFKSHLQWLKDNGYKTLTIKEFADWMDGIIELPEKSVLLTIDDGAHGTGAHNGNVLIPLLEEYQMHATLFLIAGWWDISNYQSPYLDIQSHSYNLHYEATCPDGRGMVACSDYTTVKNDLAQSLDIIKDNTSFCFPFYSYDRESLQAIQELGFRVAFVGGNVKARRTNNHYLIPRYPILSYTSLNDFIRMVS